MRTIALSIAAALVGYASVHAWTRQAHEKQLMAIDVAIASYLRPSLAGRVAFETRAEQLPAPAEIRSERIHALAEALHATPVHRDTTLVCGEVPSTCSLRGFETLLTFSEPEIIGDLASMRLSRYDRSGLPRIPITRRDYDIRLINELGIWRVMTMRLNGIT